MPELVIFLNLNLNLIDLAATRAASLVPLKGLDRVYANLFETRKEGR